MKRKSAKEILADSFRELAETQKVDRITVREITDNCGYSQATFYRQFKDKYDLIAWDYSRQTGKIMDRMSDPDYAWRNTLIDGALYFEQDKEYLANLFLHTSGLDSFLHYMTDMNEQYMRACLMQSMGTDTLDEDTSMYCRLYCLGSVALTCEWVLGRYQASAEKLAEIFENSLPAPLKPWLYTKK